LRLLGEVGTYSFDVVIDDGLPAFGADEEGAVGGVVHEEIFGEYGGARCAWFSPRRTSSKAKTRLS